MLVDRSVDVAPDPSDLDVGLVDEPAIPNGIDPVVFSVALKKCGYISMVEALGATQGLRVECDAADREQVRRAIAGVAVNAYYGSALKPDHVVFEDER